MQKITIHPVPQRIRHWVDSESDWSIILLSLALPPPPLNLPLSPSSLFWFQFIRIWATLSPAPLTRPLSNLFKPHLLLYPMGGSPCRLQAGWIYYSFPLTLAPTWLPDTALLGRSLSRSTNKMWVGQRGGPGRKLINTSGSRLGLEIRAPETG